jgi:hypothetical protein
MASQILTKEKKGRDEIYRTLGGAEEVIAGERIWRF